MKTVKIADEKVNVSKLTEDVAAVAHDLFTKAHGVPVPTAVEPIFSKTVEELVGSLETVSLNFATTSTGEFLIFDEKFPFRYLRKNVNTSSVRGLVDTDNVHKVETSTNLIKKMPIAQILGQCVRLENGLIIKSVEDSLFWVKDMSQPGKPPAATKLLSPWEYVNKSGKICKIVGTGGYPICDADEVVKYSDKYWTILESGDVFYCSAACFESVKNFERMLFADQTMIVWADKKDVPHLATVGGLNSSTEQSSQGGRAKFPGARGKDTFVPAHVVNCFYSQPLGETENMAFAVFLMEDGSMWGTGYGTKAGEFGRKADRMFLKPGILENPVKIDHAYQMSGKVFVVVETKTSDGKKQLVRVCAKTGEMEPVSPAGSGLDSTTETELERCVLRLAYMVLDMIGTKCQAEAIKTAEDVFVVSSLSKFDELFRRAAIAAVVAGGFAKLDELTDGRLCAMVVKHDETTRADWDKLFETLDGIPKGW